MARNVPRQPLLFIHLVACLVWLSMPASVLHAEAGKSTVTLVRGEIGGAPFVIAKPASWNRNLLLYAHGFRAEDAPLIARLNPDDPAYAHLLAEGWIVAATGYRRNGMIVRDAIADIHALRDHIAASDGAPSMTLLLGESMGGAIVTIIAENEPVRYQGAIAIGAAMQARDEEYPLALTGRPKIPVLFLTNRSELEGPTAYVERAARAPVPPALWTLDRDGHVNVNAAERSAAIEGLISWVTTNTIERRRDATQPGPATASTARFENGAMHGRLAEITDNYGNLFSSFTPADFEQMGIHPGDHFDLMINDRTFAVVYGSDYGTAPRGSWVAFPRAEGLVLFAINRGNAAQAAGAHEGDAMVVQSTGAR